MAMASAVLSSVVQRAEETSATPFSFITTQGSSAAANAAGLAQSFALTEFVVIVVTSNESRITVQDMVTWCLMHVGLGV